MSINAEGVVYERPWGTYQTLQLATGYQVKQLVVNPGGRLSLQRHFKRAEHWVVVKGSPTITVDDSVAEYKCNDHIFIPLQAKHRIENSTNETCMIIEVQVGDYLGEDDIERFDDIYGRA